MPFYNGASFPKPLSSSERKDLILLSKQGDTEAKKELIVDSLRLLITIINIKFDNTGIEKEELMSIGTIGLIKGVETFDINRGITLSTYVGRCIENEIRMFLRRNDNKCHKRISLDETIYKGDEDDNLTYSETICDPYDMIQYINDRMRLKSIYESFDVLDDKEKKIMRLYFGLGCNSKYQSEIAIIYGVDKSTISKVIKKCIYKIRRNLVAQKLLDLEIIIEDSIRYGDSIEMFIDEENKCKRIGNN